MKQLSASRKFRAVAAPLFCAAALLMPQLASAGCAARPLVTNPVYGADLLTAANFTPINLTPGLPNNNGVVGTVTPRLFVNLDYPLDPASVNGPTSTVSLMKVTSGPSSWLMPRRPFYSLISSTVSLSSDGCTLSVTPTAPLQNGASYVLNFAGISQWLASGVVSTSSGYLGLVGDIPAYSYLYSGIKVVPGHALMPNVAINFKVNDLFQTTGQLPYSLNFDGDYSTPAAAGTQNFVFGPFIAKATGAVAVIPAYLQVKFALANGGTFTSREFPLVHRADGSAHFTLGVCLARGIAASNQYQGGEGLDLFTVTLSDGTVLTWYASIAAWAAPCTGQDTVKITVTPY